MSCNLGIHRAISKVLNNKPWFKYKQGDTVIEILDSPAKKINEENSIGVAETVAKAINKAINDGYKNIGDIVYKGFDRQGRGIVNIAPTNKQLDLINAEDEKEIAELQKEVEEEIRQKSALEKIQEANEYVNDEGDIVSKDDIYYQVKNIFNSINELESKLKNLNKTANSIGSDKNIDNILKKAGIESELREQFIALLKSNPYLKSLKLSEVLSMYLKDFIKESDRQYYKAIDEPLSKELEDILIKYFDKFYIRKKELDNIKEKFGVDTIGVFDVLAKTIYYSKKRNLLTLPEEYGHVFVELLGSISNKKADNPLFKYLFDNIESWDGYQRVYRDYKNLYITAEGNIDIYKIKKEAIGQAIGIALVRNHKIQKGDKDFWFKIQEVIDYILNLIKGIDYVSLNTTVDNIAKDILSNNYSKLNRLQKDTSNYNLLSYSETIKTQNKKDGGLALSFMKWFSDLGNIITGSLAYRLQGATYRPEIDALHDTDMIVPSDIHNIDLNKSTYLTPEQLENDRLYRKYISEGNYKEAKKYKIQGNLRLDLEKMINNDYFKKIKEKYPDLDFLYTFYNQKANAYYITVNAIWSKDQELKDRFKSYTGSFNSRLENFTEEELNKLYLFDFFLRPETSKEYVKIKDEEYGLNLAHFNYSFYEKLNMMGRPKDAYDYQMWNYFEENNILAPDFNDRMVYFQLNRDKENQQFQKLTAEEKAKTIEQVTKEHRSITALKDLSAKLAHRIGGKVRFENNPNVDWKGYNQGMTSVLNEAYMTLDTPFHEILAHPIIRAIKNRTKFKNLDNFIEVGPYNYGTKENPKFQYELGFINDNFLQEKVKYLFDKKYDEEYNEEYYVKEFTSEKDAIDFAKKLKNELSKLSNNLYQNLLKELEYGKGKEVLDRIKRDYKHKYKILSSSEQRKIVDKREDETDQQAVVRIFGGIDKALSGKNVEINGKLYNYTRLNGLQEQIEYTLEEQQEEAIVSLISILAAGKLNEKTDRNLISLLKQLLKEMSDFIRHLLRKDVIYINKDLDNISQLTDKELNKLLKDGEVTKKCN